MYARNKIVNMIQFILKLVLICVNFTESKLADPLVSDKNAYFHFNFKKHD